MRRCEIVDRLKSDKSTLKGFGVESLAIFGSAARDQAELGSDIDILVAFNRPIGLFEFIDLKTHLEDVLERKVDLVTPDSLHPRLRENILREAVNAG